MGERVARLPGQSGERPVRSTPLLPRRRAGEVATLVHPITLARLLFRLAATPDQTYLRRRIVEETGDPDAIDLT